MARTPSAGEGKTRLRTALSDDECLRLQQAFLHDAVELALEANVGQLFLAYTPPASWDDGEFSGRVSAFPQQGEGLGTRILAALRRAESEGFSPLVVIGTDAPLLQPHHLRAALSALGDADLCLGPSADGGYYLLAVRTVPPQILAGVPWGTDRVLDTTLRIAATSGLRCTLLEPLHDVDTPADLEHLRADLVDLAVEPAFRVPRHTAELLSSALVAQVGA
jgi:hypothetical protein